MTNPTEKRRAWWEYRVAVADLGPDHPLTLDLWQRVREVDPQARRLPARRAA